MIQIYKQQLTKLKNFNPWRTILRYNFQKLSLLKCEWDSHLYPGLASEWNKLLNSLKEMTFTVPRFYFLYFNSTTVFDLHAFSDVSKRAYVTVIYLSNDEPSISVLSKTKVAPIQPVSIPRLELLLCLLLAESVETVLESLRASLTIRNIICWSDSLDALYWIKGAHKKWKLFIENKVERIS